MADRKYRQQGYRTQDAEPRGRERPAPRGSLGGGMLAQRARSRCGACGQALPIATASLDHCPSCRAAIHACRQCTHFDPSRRFECTQPLAERVGDKGAHNDCAVFSLRVTIERDVSPASPPPADVRRAFDNLFKK